MVIGMAKSQVNCVPLIMELRLLFSRPVDECRYPLQFFLVLRDQTLQPSAVVKKARLRLVIHEINNLGQDSASGMEKVGMFAGLLETSGPQIRGFGFTQI